MLKGVERLTLTIFLMEILDDAGYVRQLNMEGLVSEEREGEAYPFFRFVIAPSRSFSRWSRTLVELTQIRTREEARRERRKWRPDIEERAEGVNVGSFGS